MLKEIIYDLNNLANKNQKIILERFFKTGKDQYGENDKFLGIKVPVQREIAKKYYKETTLEEIQALLSSNFHEHRLTALLILIFQYNKSDISLKQTIYNLYINNFKYINNWDLVDLSAPKIMGEYLSTNNKDILYKLAISKNLWEKRISIISTYTFIKQNQFEDTLKISEILLKDDHDLIHKAVGWMLREIGKINQPTEEKFLKKHYKTMPRTMLRYAIEKFDEPLRQNYLKSKI